MFKRQAFKCLVLFLFSAIVMILVLDTGMGQVQFDDLINLSETQGVNWSTEIAAADDQVIVYWLDYVSGPTGGAILLAHSRDEGMTFRIWNLSPGIEQPWPPTAVVDGDNIYVGWGGLVRQGDPTSTGTFLARSDDRGKTFEPPFDITGRGTLAAPVMRIQNDILNVTWGEYDRGSNSWHIFFTKSTDFGETFSEPVRASSISQQWTIASLPVLSVDGDNVYVAWPGGRPGWNWHEIYFARSADGGETFFDTINLSNRTLQDERTGFPQLAVGSKGYVYAAWAQGLDTPPLPSYDIYFSHSTDGGETFSERLNLSKNPRASNQGLKMVAAGDNVYVVWFGLVEGINKVLFSRSTDGGKNFNEPKIISPSLGVAPQIAVIEKGKFFNEGTTDHIIYLTWDGVSGGNLAIFFSASFDSGKTFSKPQIISDSQRYSGGSHLAAVGRNVYVTWREGMYNSDAIFIRGQLELDSKSH